MFNCPRDKITDKLNFKPRKDLEIYVSKELESSFIEIVNQKASNDIVGVIYRHPIMNTTDFIETRITQVVDKLAKEKNKKVYIAGRLGQCNLLLTFKI